MEFISILIVLGLLQLWGSGGPLQHDDWFEWLSDKVRGLIASPEFSLIAMVGIPCLLLLGLQILVYSLLFGLLSLVLFVSVLLFSLGRGDFSEGIQRYLSAWNHGNFESALKQAENIEGFEADSVTDHIGLHEQVRSAVLYDGYQRWFAVVFWFLLLGPVGALAYRLSFLTMRSESLTDDHRELSQRFVFYLDWLPARLLAFSFCLAGNFVNGFNYCVEKLLESFPTEEFLVSSGLAAISSFDEKQAYPEDEERFIEYARKELIALQSLLSRSVMCWLIVIAIITLAS